MWLGGGLLICRLGLAGRPLGLGNRLGLCRLGGGLVCRGCRFLGGFRSGIRLGIGVLGGGRFRRRRFRVGGFCGRLGLLSVGFWLSGPILLLVCNRRLPAAIPRVLLFGGLRLAGA